MVYQGVGYTVVTKGQWPVPLPPLVVDAQVTSPMDVLNSSLQFNLMSDDLWMQLVFFLNTTSTYQVSGGHQMGYAGVEWPVQLEYQPIVDFTTNKKKATLTSFVPTGYTISQDAPLADYRGNPILTEDFLNGFYKIEVFNSPTNTEISVRIMNVTGMQVWSRQPYVVNTLAKCVACELVGFGAGSKTTFTKGSLRSTFTSVQSTVQSGPNQGQTLEPLPITVFTGAPSYTDAITGNVYAYQVETGEVGNLTDTLTQIAQDRILQIDATPV